MTIVQQTKVRLKCADNLVTFQWPLDTAHVYITQSLRGGMLVLPIEEAHCLFDGLLDAGAY